jgi:hypothetical protein
VPGVSRRPDPPRRQRRARERAQTKLVRDQERLARLQPGGSPERPLEVESPAQVDVIAGSTACPLCDGSLQLSIHAAETVGGVRLRVARLTCTRCGVPRTLYFRLVEPQLH